MHMVDKNNYTEEQIQAVRVQRSRDMALVEAAKQNNLAEVKRLHCEGAHIVGWESHGRTALHHAAIGGYYDLAKFMLEHGAEVDARDSSLCTPLHFAADYGHCTLIRLLIQHGATIEGPDLSTNITPLHFAVIRNRPDAVKTLLELGADVNKGGAPVYDTPLHTAALQSNLPMASILLEYGADVTIADKNGKTAVDIARDEGHRGMELLLREHGGEDIQKYFGEERLNNALIEACKQNDVDEARRLLEAGADVHTLDTSVPKHALKHIPLTIAAENGNEELVLMLLEHGAEVDKRNSFHYRPLQYAAENGYCGIIRILVEHGAVVNLPCLGEWEAVQFAVDEGHFDALKLLVELGADVNTEDDDGCTLIGQAADDDDKLDMIAYLIEHGADVNKGDYGGYTPLHLAAYFGQTAIAELFLKSGANVNAVGQTEYYGPCTPLDQAANYSESAATVELLKAWGAKNYEELRNNLDTPKI